MALINSPQFVVTALNRPNAFRTGSRMTRFRKTALFAGIVGHALGLSAVTAAPPAKPAAQAAQAAPTAPNAASTPPAPPVPPAGDLWRKPSAPAAWTIAFKYNTQVTKLQEASRLSGIGVTMIGNNFSQTVQVGGRTFELWKVDGMMFQSEVNSDTANQTLTDESIQAELAARNNDVNFSTTSGRPPEEINWASLSEFAWIKPELYKGAVAVGGQVMLIYAILPPQTPAIKGKAPQKWPAGPLGGLPLQPGIHVAAIEESTRLPKYLQDGLDISIYNFRTPEKTTLEIPLKVKKLLDEMKPAAAPRAINTAP